MTFRRMVPRSAALVLASALVIAGCSGGDSADPDPDPSQRDAKELVQSSPLTGLELSGGLPENPVFVVKIENTSAGAPQIALDQADLVIEELVEGGLTRLAALYYSQLPSKIGHIRSLRTTDIGIARPVEGAIVASGGAGTALRRIESAGVPVYSEDNGSPGFSGDPSKVRPYNRLVDLKRIAKEADVTTPKQPLLPWTAEGETADPGTSKIGTATSVSVRFSRSTTTTWKLSGERWTRSNGHASKEFAADNLIIMFCRITDAGYTDPAGNPVPTTELEGSGRAIVLRGKDTVELTWKKTSLDAPITFENADGQPYTLTPGRSFLELVPQGDGAVDLK